MPTVVTMGNSLSTLAYAVFQLETRLTRRRRAHVRALLAQAVLDLQDLKRGLAC